MRAPRLTLAVALIASSLIAAKRIKPPSLESIEEKTVTEHISAQSLRGRLSFLASDLLEGRDSPSRGLDIAAEYIASEFRRIGLEEAGDDGYFQTVKMVMREQSKTGWSLSVYSASEELMLSEDQIGGLASKAVELNQVPLFKITKESQITADLDNSVIFVDTHNRSLMRKLGTVKPAAILSIPSSAIPHVSPRLMDTEEEPKRLAVYVKNGVLTKLLDALPSGRTGATVSLRAPAPIDTPAVLRNVIGLLRGSDPVLKDTYIFVTAHYDHLGVKPDGDGDRIYNGANDDGSGTVSVIEIASAMASLEHRPKRSIVFMTVFGEEKGLIGSRYYAKHPIFPLEKTVADINLEQVGRTDDLIGQQLGSASITGMTYSDVGLALREAGEKTGVKIREDAKNSDEYFARSDNLSFAEKGIPAHTIGVAYAFPDYHSVSDEWQKIDYTNMANIDRMVASALLLLANNPVAPKWDADNPKTEPYRKAIHP